MAMEAYLTSAGLTVLNKIIAAKGTLTFTKAELGSGKVSGEAACRARTSLVTKITDASLVSVNYEGGEAVVTAQYSNAGLGTGFFVNEIGIYVKDPTTSNSVLYCYVTFGDNPDWIAPASSAQYVRTYDVVTIISSAASVAITASPSAMVTQKEFDEYASAIDDTIRALISNYDMLIRDQENRIKTLEAQIEALTASA